MVVATAEAIEAMAAAVVAGSILKRMEEEGRGHDEGLVCRGRI